MLCRGTLTCALFVFATPLHGQTPDEDLATNLTKAAEETLGVLQKAADEAETLDKYDKILDATEKWIKAFSKENSQIWNIRAQIWTAKGSFARAETENEKAVKFASTERALKHALYTRATISLHLGREREAARDFKVARELLPGADVYLALLAMKEKDFGKAKEILSTMAEGRPVLWYALCLLGEGKGDEAADVSARYLRQSSGTASDEEWVRSMHSFVARKYTRELLLSLAEGSDFRICEANFLLGLVSTFGRDTHSARQLFERCVATKRYRSKVYPVAQSLLQNSNSE
jgi:tetratricopeptide (TPR) repeat protein